MERPPGDAPESELCDLPITARCPLPSRNHAMNNPLVRLDRVCPKCESPSYAFRARRTLEHADAEGGPRLEVETKFRCKACSSEWRERVPAPPGTLPPKKPDAA